MRANFGVDDSSAYSSTRNIEIGDSDLINVRFGPLCALKADISEVRDVLTPDKLKTLMVSRDLPRHAMLALAALKHER